MVNFTGLEEKEGSTENHDSLCNIILFFWGCQEQVIVKILMKRE